MFSLAEIGLVVLVLSALTYIRLSRGISYVGGVPRVGKSGVLGYIQGAFKWTLDAGGLIKDGRKQFSGKSFVIPTLSGPIFFLGPEYLERVRAGPDSVFSEFLSVNESLQLPYTMDEHQLVNPYQARVMRTDVNRALPVYIPHILDESILSVHEALKPSGQEESTNIVVFDTMTYMVARVSNRVIFGKELCRDEKFLHAIVRFAETLPLMATPLSWCPKNLRPVVYFILSSIVGGKKAPLKTIIPFLKRHTKDREATPEEPTLVYEYMMKAALPQESVERIAVRMLNINFGSIHTSSIFITQALFEIALLSSEDLENMRSEIRQALESEGGWNKAAVDKLYMVDSALREVGRCYGLMHFALPRVAMVPCDLGDGTHVPAGSQLAVDMTAIHFDPRIYPDPHRCDLFRFSKLRKGDEGDVKYAFSSVSAEYLPFGAGRHACAGRTFASTELKIMLAHMLLEYDMSFPPGVTERPKNLIFNGGVVPNPKARMIFKRRRASIQ